MAQGSLAPLSRQSNLFISVSYSRGQTTFVSGGVQVVSLEDLKGQAERAPLPKLDCLLPHSLSPGSCPQTVSKV